MMTHNRPTFALFPAIVQSSEGPRVGGGCFEADYCAMCLPACRQCSRHRRSSGADLAAAGAHGRAYPSTKVWLPPHEITAIVRSTGLKPLHRPARHGASYAVRALAPTGEEVRVILDARIGIVRIDPVRMPIYAMPATPDGPRLGMVPMQERPRATVAAPPAAAQTSPPSGAHVRTGHGRNHRVGHSAGCVGRTAGVTCCHAAHKRCSAIGLIEDFFTDWFGATARAS